MSNKVFIATSIDGYIADTEGGVGFLDMIEIPEGNDMGYYEFMSDIDAIIMGRKSFETVLSFGVPWPYQVPVFVLTKSITLIPEGYEDKIQLVQGTIQEILDIIHQQGFQNLYIDGGSTIQHFLKEDLIDELIITTIPVILGNGIPLFGTLENPLAFTLNKSITYVDELVQRWYRRKI